jgi:hypothetical protein
MGIVATTDPRTVRSRLTAVHESSASAAIATGTVRNSMERLTSGASLALDTHGARSLLIAAMREVAQSAPRF